MKICHGGLSDSHGRAADDRVRLNHNLELVVNNVPNVFEELTLTALTEATTASIKLPLYDGLWFQSGLCSS